MRRGETHAAWLRATVLLIALVLVACSQSAIGTPSTTRTDGTDSGGTGAEPGDTTGVTHGADPACDIPEGDPFIEGDSVEVTEIGEIDGVRVSAGLYPRPDYEGNPWSQWGQGIVLPDGRFFSAIGDHLAEDGNSYVYEYDPARGLLTMVGDVLSYVDHVPGTWGYGKIHSQMVPGPCGEVYFSTYWGSFRDIEFEGNYRGDHLFRLDPYGRTLNALDVPVDLHGQASLAADPTRGLVYGEAIDPVIRGQDIERGPFFVYDVTAEETVYTGPDEPHVGYRSVMVDASGRAYYSIGGSELSVYDPESGEETTHGSTLPGDWLRAASAPGPDGSVYGVTEDPQMLFVMRPDGDIESLGDALGYTASVALSPDGTRFFYMPGAHGNSGDWGSPLVSVDTGTGEQTVVVELYDLIGEATGFILGGTYDVVVADDGKTVFVGANVSTDDSGFGDVMLIVVELP